MIFRLTVAIIVSIFGSSAPVLLIADPIGSLAARSGLAETLQVNALPLIIGAVQGMIFTMADVLFNFVKDSKYKKYYDFRHKDSAASRVFLMSKAVNGLKKNEQVNSLCSFFYCL
ncbi:hypothetical protein [Alteribacillus bidgolensis]|uniref:Uncharacterized protein n=1 Tax=Alteribacillus bidgolensis TaxID=930129 RepID=A0A1G8CJ31_9BACI|nr:hypothetical protein [Alteribacillus bidgolensis]SDH45501.1 hypothetical protein SAMN05216352_101341 [Alteribacillus bidgolensis]